MASENRPGVIVVQELSETPAAVSAPTLVPVVVGPCYQIVESVEGDGSLNTDAKYADEQYNQVALAIPQADLPDPRSNIDEVNIDESQVDLSLYFGGLLSRIARGSNSSTGSSFLKAVNEASKPAFFTVETASTLDFSAGGDAGLLLTLAFDLPSSAVTSNDVTIAFTSTMTTAEIVDAINGAVGSSVAEVIENGNSYGISVTSGQSRVLVSSLGFGATSNITIRANGSAIPVLFGSVTTATAAAFETQEHHIEGCGFRGEDDSDGDLTTPWIQWHRGAYKFGTAGTALTGNDAASDAFNSTGDFIGLINLDGEYSGSKGADVTFSGSAPTVPLVAATATTDGDEFWADGVQVGSGVVTVVEQRRFKIGVLDTALSSFDGNGDPTSAVYSTIEVNTPSHGTSFAPKYAYFIANNLVYGEVTPEGTKASQTGADTFALAERSAYVVTGQVSSTITDAVAAAQDFLLAGGTLTIQITEDGVQGDEMSFNLSEGSQGGSFANLAELAADLSDGFSGVDVIAMRSGSLAVDDLLVFSTSKTGSDQSISVKTTGSNSVASQLGITSTLSATGKDVEYAVRATVISDPVTLPLPKDQAAGLVLTVVDSLAGTHQVTLGEALSSHGTLDALAQAMTGDDDGSSPSPDGFFDIRLNNDPASYDSTAPVVAQMYFVDADGNTLTTLSGKHGRVAFRTVEGGGTSSIDLAFAASGGSDADLALLGLTNSGYDADIGDTAVTDGTNIIVAADTVAVSDGTTTFTYTAPGNIDTAIGVVNALNAAADWSSDPTDKVQFYLVPATGGSVGDDLTANVQIGVRLIDGGTLDALTGTSITGQNFFSGVTAATISGDTGQDTGEDALSGTRLAFYLDDNPYAYEVDFTSNSLQDAIDLINTTVGGATDIASETASKLTLTSSFAGAASSVEVDDTLTQAVSNSASFDAGIALGMTQSGRGEGSGRPNPDFYQDGSGTVYVGANILRNRSSGVPYSLASALADIYFDYVGLRLDVSASAEEPGLLSFDDVSTMIAAIGPVSTDNPLALACFLQLSNAPSQTVSALGISETAAAAPMGTVTSHAEALDFLEARDVYAIAPLTDDPFVQQLYATHVESMSTPEERGERIAFIWQPQPSRAADTSIQSGTDAETNGTDNSVTLGENPVSAIIGAGASDVSNITVDDGIYMELVLVSLGSTEVRNYSISSQSGVLSFFRTSFAAGENDDGFYSTTTLPGDSDFTGLTYAIRERGGKLLVTGTTIPDYNAIATAAAAAGTSYASRRVFHVYCDSADTSIDGVVTNVPGYYTCAAITGMVAEQPPQQPFTRLSMTGFSQVYGTDDTFSENQLDTIADGGRYVLINQGGRIASRHQRSTATTSIEARELSITKAIDFLAKGLRATNRVYIGRFVINPGFIDQLVMSNEGFLARTVQSGVVNSAALKSVLQDESAPDTVLIEVEVAPAYPCNKIRITIVS